MPDHLTADTDASLASIVVLRSVPFQQLLFRRRRALSTYRAFAWRGASEMAAPGG